MNIQLANTEEFVDGVSSGTLGQVLIRCVTCCRLDISPRPRPRLRHRLPPLLTRPQLQQRALDRPGQRSRAQSRQGHGHEWLRHVPGLPPHPRLTPPRLRMAPTHQTPAWTWRRQCQSAHAPAPSRHTPLREGHSASVGNGLGTAPLSRFYIASRQSHYLLNLLHHQSRLPFVLVSTRLHIQAPQWTLKP